MIDGQTTVVFSGDEAGYLVDILEHVYSIKTMDGSDCEVLKDLIEALDNADRILIQEEEALDDRD